MDTHSEELELFRDHIRRFVGECVEPHYEAWEREGRLPREIYQQLGRQGLLCADIPEQYGGAGATFPFSIAVLEEIYRLGYGALASTLTVHSDIVAHYILHLGTEEQKQKYLPGMCSGDKIGAVAMTEPGAGSDLQGIKTTALPDGEDHFRINGAKTFITNGQNGAFVIVAAKTDPKLGAKGTTLFLVDTDLPGFSRGRNLHKVGHHSADTSELFFDDVRVPRSAILGTLGNGFGHLVNELARERLAVAAGVTAHAQGALDKTIEYVTQRKAFGQSVSAFQNTRFELARMKTEIEVHRAFVEKCAARFARGDLDAVSAAMAKLSASEMEGRVCDACLQLFGGYGYMAEYPISRYWADARIHRIYGGTSEIMKEIIGRSIVGRA